MATRMLGPTGSKRRKRFLFVPALLVVLTALLVIGSAQGLPTTPLSTYFELGPGSSTDETGLTNILGNSTNPGPDWADLFNADGTKATSGSPATPVCEQSPGKECAFIADASSAGGALDPTTFSGFGTSNKNGDPISTTDCNTSISGNTYASCTPWGWDPGNIPAKDDLTNVYSYEVIPTSGDRANHVILYGGIEREDPSGDSHVDLEYFQSPVSRGTSSNFVGNRTIGDVVVSMDFLKGGALGSVTIRKWNGSTFDLQGTAAGQGCYNPDGSAATTAGEICAFNNGGSISGGPWPNYNNHGALITALQKNAFTEVGVDLTDVLGASPCISSFMGKTRSSGSFTSELKDFAGPTTFSICQPSTLLTKTATDGNGNTVTTVHSGDSVTYLYAEQNDGKDPLSNVSVSDPSCTPLVAGLKTGGNQDNILDPGETWNYSCVATLTATTTNTATATGTDTLTGKTVTWCDPNSPDPANTVCDQDEQAQATVTVIAPATTLTKTAAVSVTYTFKEANTGNDDLSGVSVTDAYGATAHNTGLSACTVSPVLGDGSTTADSTHNIGDLNNDGSLNAITATNAAETWTFQCTVSSTDGSNVDVWNLGTGHGTDSLGTAVPSTNESDGVKVAVTHCAGPCS